MHVTEACDADAAHLITHVMTRLAMHPGIENTAVIHEKPAERGLLQAGHLVDAVYVNADLLITI